MFPSSKSLSSSRLLPQLTALNFNRNNGQGMIAKNFCFHFVSMSTLLNKNQVLLSPGFMSKKAPDVAPKIVVVFSQGYLYLTNVYKTFFFPKDTFT